MSHSAASQGGGYAAMQVLGTAPAAGDRLRARAAAALGRASLLRVWAVKAEETKEEGEQAPPVGNGAAHGAAAMDGGAGAGDGGDGNYGGYGAGDGTEEDAHYGESWDSQAYGQGSGYGTGEGGYGAGEEEDAGGEWEGPVQEVPPTMQRMPVAGSFLWRRAGCVAWCRSVFSAVSRAAGKASTGETSADSGMDTTLRLLAGASRALEGCVSGACVSIERREAKAGLDPSSLLEGREGKDAVKAWVACVARRCASLGGEFGDAIGAGLRACIAVLLGAADADSSKAGADVGALAALAARRG